MSNQTDAHNVFGLHLSMKIASCKFDPSRSIENVVCALGKTVQQVFFVCTEAAEDLPRFQICHQVSSLRSHFGHCCRVHI